MVMMTIIFIADKIAMQDWVKKTGVMKADKSGSVDMACFRRLFLKFR